MDKIQVSLLGQNSLFGRISSLLLKQSKTVKGLALYDDYNIDSVKDISLINTSCKVEAFLGKEKLNEAVKGADVVIIGDDPLSTPHTCFDVMAKKICEYARAIANNSPNAVVIIAASPVNILVPLFSEVVKECGTYDSSKIIGTTAVDNSRANCILAYHLKASPHRVTLPVVGGATKETRVPLFSRAKPSVKLTQDTMERIVRDVRAFDNRVFSIKGSPEALNKAYATIKFLKAVFSGLRGGDAIDIAFSRTSVIPGVEYFSLPVKLGRSGIQKSFRLPKLLPFEEELIQNSIEILNSDIEQAKTCYLSRDSLIETVFPRKDEDVVKTEDQTSGPIKRKNDNLSVVSEILQQNDPKLINSSKTMSEEFALSQDKEGKIETISDKIFNTSKNLFQSKVNDLELGETTSIPHSVYVLDDTNEKKLSEPAIEVKVKDESPPDSNENTSLNTSKNSLKNKFDVLLSKRESDASVVISETPQEDPTEEILYDKQLNAKSIISSIVERSVEEEINTLHMLEKTKLIEPDKEINDSLSPSAQRYIPDETWKAEKNPIGIEGALLNEKESIANYSYPQDFKETNYDIKIPSVEENQRRGKEKLDGQRIGENDKSSSVNVSKFQTLEKHSTEAEIEPVLSENRLTGCGGFPHHEIPVTKSSQGGFLRNAFQNSKLHKKLYQNHIAPPAANSMIKQKLLTSFLSIFGQSNEKIDLKEKNAGKPVETRYIEQKPYSINYDNSTYVGNKSNKNEINKIDMKASDFPLDIFGIRERCLKRGKVERSSEKSQMSSVEIQPESIFVWKKYLKDNEVLDENDGLMNSPQRISEGLSHSESSNGIDDSRSQIISAQTNNSDRTKFGHLMSESSTGNSVFIEKRTLKKPYENNIGAKTMSYVRSRNLFHKLVESRNNRDEQTSRKTSVDDVISTLYEDVNFDIHDPLKITETPANLNNSSYGLSKNENSEIVPFGSKVNPSENLCAPSSEALSRPLNSSLNTEPVNTTDSKPETPDINEKNDLPSIGSLNEETKAPMGFASLCSLKCDKNGCERKSFGAPEVKLCCEKPSVPPKVTICKNINATSQSRNENAAKQDSPNMVVENVYDVSTASCCKKKSHNELNMCEAVRADSLDKVLPQTKIENEYSDEQIQELREESVADQASCGKEMDYEILKFSSKHNDGTGLDSKTKKMDFLVSNRKNIFSLLKSKPEEFRKHRHEKEITSALPNNLLNTFKVNIQAETPKVNLDIFQSKIENIVCDASKMFKLDGVINSKTIHGLAKKRTISKNVVNKKNYSKGLNVLHKLNKFSLLKQNKRDSNASLTSSPTNKLVSYSANKSNLVQGINSNQCNEHIKITHPMSKKSLSPPRKGIKKQDRHSIQENHIVSRSFALKKPLLPLAKKLGKKHVASQIHSDKCENLNVKPKTPLKSRASPLLKTIKDACTAKTKKPNVSFVNYIKANHQPVVISHNSISPGLKEDFRPLDSVENKTNTLVETNFNKTLDISLELNSSLPSRKIPDTRRNKLIPDINGVAQYSTSSSMRNKSPARSFAEKLKENTLKKKITFVKCPVLPKRFVCSSPRKPSLLDILHRNSEMKRSLKNILEAKENETPSEEKTLSRSFVKTNPFGITKEENRAPEEYWKNIKDTFGKRVLDFNEDECEETSLTPQLCFPRKNSYLEQKFMEGFRSQMNQEKLHKEEHRKSQNTMKPRSSVPPVEESTSSYIFRQRFSEGKQSYLENVENNIKKDTILSESNICEKFRLSSMIGNLYKPYTKDSTNYEYSQRLQLPTFGVLPGGYNK